MFSPEWFIAMGFAAFLISAVAFIGAATALYVKEQLK